MKHHPIVFAIGNAVPVVAVALDDYYLHKNRGALEFAGLAHFVLNKEQFFSTESEKIISKALKTSSAISERMQIWVKERRVEEEMRKMGAAIT